MSREESEHIIHLLEEYNFVAVGANKWILNEYRAYFVYSGKKLYRFMMLKAVEEVINLGPYPTLSTTLNAIKSALVKVDFETFYDENCDA